MRASATGPRPKRSGRTATTAFRTLTLRYTFTLVTLTTAVRLITTLLITRGPPPPVAVQFHVGHVDDRGAIDHGVVDHARAAPAAPPRPADEAGPTPPRHA